MAFSLRRTAQHGSIATRVLLSSMLTGSSLHRSLRSAPAVAGRGSTPAVAALAFAAALGGWAGTGCSSADEHARDERRMLGALGEARDAVCACRDLDCAEAAERRLADFLLLHVDSLKKIPAPRRTSTAASGAASTAASGAAAESVASKAARLDGELRACKHHLEEAARAS